MSEIVSKLKIGQLSVFLLAKELVKNYHDSKNVENIKTNSYLYRFRRF